MTESRPDPEAVFAVIAECLAHPQGLGGWLEEREIKNGGKLIPIGSRTPFLVSPLDWREPHLIAVRGREARIVAIHAKRKRQGCFTRLVMGIAFAGLTPVVVAPVLEDMPAILKKWGWRERIENPDDFESQWRPPW